MSEHNKISFTATRVTGLADVEIHLAAEGTASKAYLRMPQIRGFHILAEGRPAEELPRIVARICGMCPWHHHMGATMAVEQALGLNVPPAARQMRSLALLLAHISDKIMHFFVLSAPDINPHARHEEAILPLLSGPTAPKMAMDTRQRVGQMLKKLTGQPWGGDAAVIGGMTSALSSADHEVLLQEIDGVLQFCLHSIDEARDEVLRPLNQKFHNMDTLPLPSLGCVSPTGALELNPTADSRLRFIHPDGTQYDFAPADYEQYIVEEYADWTQSSFPRLRDAPPLRLDPESPQGVYRVGPLPRIHACDHISTPLAQKELELFRQEHGKLPQRAMLYHWARLIELLHCAERAQELLLNPEITDTDVLDTYFPERQYGDRQGFAHLEAPRGSLFYRVTVDPQDCITSCTILTPSAQNNAAMNLSLTQAVRATVKDGTLDQDSLKAIATCLRAYDPCPACATHALLGPGPLTVSLRPPLLPEQLNFERE